MNGMGSHNTKISVITPLYKGRRFVDDVIEQVEAANRNVDCKIELIFVNDFPEDYGLIQAESENFEIKIIDEGINRGIHGARVTGLNNAVGEYVLFLDQDDIIFPEYFKSQLCSIDDNDISVCQCLHENSMFYNEWFVFGEVVNLQNMLNRGNTIVSPGQCLIRKNSIPESWKKHIMNVNCADDYFLWILLFESTDKIALNYDVLFEHIVKGSNFSMDFVNLEKSEDEMLGLIRKNKLINEIDCETLSNCLRRNHTDRLAYLQRYRRLFITLRNIVIRDKEFSISSLLKEKKINSVAIYGAGEIGRIIRILIGDEIQVKCYIDMDYKNKNEDIPVFPMDDVRESFDAVIISLTAGYDRLKQDIESKLTHNVYTIEDLISFQ